MEVLSFDLDFPSSLCECKGFDLARWDPFACIVAIRRAVSKDIVDLLCSAGKLFPKMQWPIGTFNIWPTRVVSFKVVVHNSSIRQR